MLAFGDSTFEVCPTQFCQLYTNDVSLRGKIIPVVYALLPSIVKDEVHENDGKDQE